MAARRAAGQVEHRLLDSEQRIPGCVGPRSGLGLGLGLGVGPEPAFGLRLGLGLRLGVAVNGAHSVLRPADLPNLTTAFSELTFAIISADRWRVVIDHFSVFSWVCSVDSFAVAVVSTTPMRRLLVSRGFAKRRKTYRRNGLPNSVPSAYGFTPLWFRIMKT